MKALHHKLFFVALVLAGAAFLLVFLTPIALYIIGFILFLAKILLVYAVIQWILKDKSGWEGPLLLGAIVFFALVGLAVRVLHPGGPLDSFKLIWEWTAFGIAAFAAIAGVMEYIVLRGLANFRLGAIVRITYYEVLLQPFTLIILGAALAHIVLFSFCLFYTFDRDDTMYRDLASQFVLMATLVIMVYAAAKVIDEEIENRTMLTLMSKPIARWQVVLGKYLGVLAVCLVSIAILGVATAICSYLRSFDDKRLDFGMVKGNEIETAKLYWDIYKALLALLPLFVLQFLEIATLAAIAVAISTRFALAFNVTAIVTVYIVANLTQYLPAFAGAHVNLQLLTLAFPVLLAAAAWGVARTARSQAQGIVKAVLAVVIVAAGLGGFVLLGQALDKAPAAITIPIPANALAYASHVLPHLSHFDLSQRLIYSNFTVTAKEAVGLPGVPSYAEIWSYTGLAGLYAVAYITAALAAATALFRTRELT